MRSLVIQVITLLGLIIPSLASAVTPMVGAGDYHSIALKSDGTVMAWGNNNLGQLWFGPEMYSATPGAVSALSNVVAVASGGNHNLALRTDGRVMAWGYNGNGQLGGGSLATAIPGLTGVIAISAGYAHTMALKSDGTVVTCGYNRFGQLGDLTTTDRGTPLAVQGLADVVAVAAGGFHSVALKSDGTVVSWGFNYHGQLGNGTSTDSLSPAPVTGLTGVVAIAAGMYHTVALKSDGTLVAWGYNYAGGLGDGTSTSRSTPVAVVGISGVVAISAGSGHTVAITSGGKVLTWGANEYGQLGTTNSHLLPQEVPGLTGVSAIAAGGYHTIAVKTDRTVSSFGYNVYGQLGDGTTLNSASPVAVLAIPGKTGQVITFGSAPAISAGATAAVSATATSGLAVSFTSLSPDVCTVSGSAVTGVSAGTCTISANQSGDTSYFPAPQVTQSITIGKGSQTVNFGPVPAISVGRVVTITASTTSGLPASFTSTTPTTCSVTGSTVNGIAVGTCTIAADQAGNASYSAAAQVTQSIAVWAVTTTPKFAYVANYGSNTVSVYTINPATGALSAVSTAAAGSAPMCVTVDPTGRFAYVANGGSNNISVYTINQATGALTAGTMVAAGTSPSSVSVDPTGKFAYVTNEGSKNVSAYTINQVTGALTAGTTVAAGSTPYSVTVDPSGRFAYVTNNSSSNVSVYTINQANGALSAGTDVAAGSNPGAVAVDPSGRFAYVANTGSDTVFVYAINQVTGALTAASTAPGSFPMSVTVHPSGKFAYVTNIGSNRVSVFTINQSTGALTAVTTVATAAYPKSVAIDPSGKFAYVANYASDNVSVYTINQSTGALTAGTTVATGSAPYAVTTTGGFASVPGVPTAISAVAGNAQVEVSFTAPADSGGFAITGYTVTSNPDALAATGITSPITVTGLTNGKPYTFTVIATNRIGTGAASAASTAVTAKADQTVTFGGAPAIYLGGTGTVSANATSGLAVSFNSMTTDICSITGKVVTGISGGTCIIAANQMGDANYLAAPQVTQSISIGKASQSINFVAAPTIALKGTGTVSAAASSGLPVSFSSTTPDVCSVSGATVTSLTAGTCIVAAHQAGSASFLPATQVTQAITINKAVQTIGAVSFSSTTIPQGGSGTVSGSSSSTLPVSFSSATPAICSVNGSTVTGIAPGTCTILASQAGDNSYSAADQASQSIPITPVTSGTVLDFSTGNPLGAATVTATGGATTQTNPSGYFVLDVPSGVYDFSIAKAGYKSVIIRNVIVSTTSAGTVKTGLVPTTSASLNFKASPTLPAASIGDSYSQLLTITGGNGPYTFELAYNLLPAGLVLDAVIGVISGHATASGTITFGIGVTDSLGAYAEREFTISVSSPLSIATQSLPRGMVARSYYAAILPSGGAEPYTFSQFSRAFPIGLSLDPAKGILQGKITDNPGAYTYAIKVVDQDGRSAVQSYTLNVDPSLTLGTPVLDDAVVGTAYNRTVAASGGLAPYAFTVYAGELPAGLALDRATGVISGTPSAAGSAPITVTVTDSIDRFVQKAYTLRALNPLQIPTTTLPNGFVGAAYSELVRVTGGIAPYSFSTVDTLPTGLNLNNVTGIVSGLPTAGGLTNVAITVTDSTWPTPQTRNVSIGIRISSQLTITSTSIFPNARKGVAVTPVTLAARGGSTPYLWSVIANQNGDTSNLPQGMSLNPATGIVSGTPADWGDYTFTIRVTDAAGIPVTANKQFYLHVSDTLQVATGTVPTAAVGEPYSAALSATGGLKNYSWIVKNGALPAGLSLDSVSGTVSGTPVSKIISTVTFEVADSDAPPQSAQKSLAFEVADTLTISETALPNGRKGEAYAANVRSLPSAPAFAWKLAGGTLPPGISLLQNAGIASLQGTATTPGSYTFTLEVTDDGSPAKTASRQFTVVIYGPLTVTTTALSNAQRGLPYNAALAASGGALPYLWRVVSGSLPLGLVVNSATGAISGITNADIGFTASFTVRVTDGGTPAAYLERTFTIQAVDPMVITTTAIQGALQNSPFSAALAGHGGISPLTWSVAVGSLPAGVSVNSSTGVVSGTPTTCGSFPFTVELADSSPVPAKVQAGFTLVTICSATGPYALSVTLAGTGTGSVNSSPSGIACTGGNCSAQFANGTTVTLLQSPSGSSRFGGWSGACTGTGSCSVSMTGTRAVTATFSKVPVNMIGTTGYDSLGQAYAAAPLGVSTTITALDGTLVESLQLNSNKMIVLKGGYNADYLGRSGEPTVIQGALKISSGKLTVDRVELRKP